MNSKRMFELMERYRNFSLSFEEAEELLMLQTFWIRDHKKRAPLNVLISGALVIGITFVVVGIVTVFGGC